jgi:subtilase family serine protease
MKLYSIAVAAIVLNALSTFSFSQSNHASTAKEVQILGAADQATVTSFHVFFPLTHKNELEKLLVEQTDSNSSNYHHWLTPAQFKEQFGANRSDVAKVTAALLGSGMRVVGENAQSIQVEGSVQAVNRMFSTQLQRVQMANGHVKLAASGRHLNLPETLASVGAVVPEFTTHLAAHVHSQRTRSLTAFDPLLRLTSTDSFFYPNDLAEAYSHPSFITEVTPPSSSHTVQLAGIGSTIGIVISSVISPSDLANTFNSTINLGGGQTLVQSYSTNTSVPVPTVTIDPVEGGSGAFNPNSDDAAEASLDTQMSLGTAPGAKEILYDMPDLADSAIIAAYTQVDEENRVDVVSSSFGECELDFTAAANGGIDFTGVLQTFHSLFAQGNAQGITFVASSGDNGAVPCTSTAFDNNPTNGTNFVLGVENPASDPDVTAVGGTNLQTAASPGIDDAKYVSENANFDPRLPASFQISATQSVTVGNNTWGSGGGYSIIFAKPTYQSLVSTGSNTARALPDVSLMMGGCPGDANLSAQDCTVLPRSAAIVWIGGEPDLLIGTSSSSPEFAGVLALLVELNGGRLGNVNSLLYSSAHLQNVLGGASAPAHYQFFHRGITGNNNGFTVAPGQAFSEVLGNGTLDVKNFLGEQAATAAGAPNTASNP